MVNWPYPTILGALRRRKCIGSHNFRLQPAPRRLADRNLAQRLHLELVASPQPRTPIIGRNVVTQARGAFVANGRSPSLVYRCPTRVEMARPLPGSRCFRYLEHVVRKRRALDAAQRRHGSPPLKKGHTALLKLPNKGFRRHGTSALGRRGFLFRFRRSGIVR